MKILLDNGHGYNTAGKRSPVWPDGTQLLEFDYNRILVQLIYTQLKAKGYEVEILVPELIDISLPERVIRANKLNAERDCTLVSIHGNAFGTEDVNGFEVFTHPNASMFSKELAEFIYKEFERHDKFKLRPDYSDGYADKNAKFTILTCNCPAVLTESGFYTNKKDCDYMMSVLGQNEIAALHTQGIINYLKHLEK